LKETVAFIVLTVLFHALRFKKMEAVVIRVVRAKV